jgi:hypothetical protein
MEIVIEVSLDDYYCLRAKCRRSAPEYSILQNAIFRPNAFGISGDKFEIRCQLNEAKNLLDLAAQLSLQAAHEIEESIHRARNP